MSIIGPPPDYDIIPSIRLSHLRDGMKDYEYFHYLQSLTSRLDPARSRRLLRKCREQLNVPGQIIESVFNYTNDLSLINRKRAEIARCIRKAEENLAASAPVWPLRRASSAAGRHD